MVALRRFYVQSGFQFCQVESAFSGARVIFDAVRGRAIKGGGRLPALHFVLSCAEVKTFGRVSVEGGGWSFWRCAEALRWGVIDL